MKNNNWYWLTEDSRTILSRGYIPSDNEIVTKQEVKDRVRVICNTFENYLNLMNLSDKSFEGYSDKLYDYVSKGWVSFSSPVWSNYGTDRGLPVSCNNSHITDSVEGILYTASEIGMMTKYGSGTSAYLGELRPRGSSISVGGYSYGPSHFVPIYESTVDIVSQSNVRRGNCAIYQDVEHPDISEFLEFREEGSPVQHLSLGVVLGDEWLNEMLDGDPSDSSVQQKRNTWKRILRKREETGYPYLFFRDNANNDAPSYYKGKIKSSNLCNECHLPSNSEESFVCVTCSANVAHFHEWKDTDFIQTFLMFLDTVNEEYVQKTENLPFMQRPHRFAKNHRALGLSQLGYHSLLLSKNLPYESEEARSLNIEIAQYINSETKISTVKMGEWFGPCIAGDGVVRNTTRLMNAPTTSSSAILGFVSPSTEPLQDNYFIKDLAKGKFSYRNPHLTNTLESYNKNNEEIWSSILRQAGSVQHLSFLTPHEKEVFKTFEEISQFEIITQAATRQQYIDQGQSLNVKINSNTSAKEISDLLIAGWRMGIKGFYYHISTNSAQSKTRSLMNCTACEA